MNLNYVCWILYICVCVCVCVNSSIPKRHAKTLWNWNISFQLKKQNTYQNGIDNLDFNSKTPHRHPRNTYKPTHQLKIPKRVHKTWNQVGLNMFFQAILRFQTIIIKLLSSHELMNTKNSHFSGCKWPEWWHSFSSSKSSDLPLFSLIQD